MLLGRLMSKSKLLARSRHQILSKRNIAGDVDNYQLKYPAATITAIGLLIIAYGTYRTWTYRQRLDELEIVFQPFSERQREPDPAKLAFKSKFFRP